MKKNDLEIRLMNFAVLIVKIAEFMPVQKAANQIAGQLLRSGVSSALNYGKAQSGEFRKNFMHKIKIVLEELRESRTCLKIIYRTNLYKADDKIILALDESHHLIANFAKSV
jgi:four helix bundle protein